MKVCHKMIYLRDIKLGEVFKTDEYSEDYFIKAENNYDLNLNDSSVGVVNLITGIYYRMYELRYVIKINGGFLEDRCE